MNLDKMHPHYLRSAHAQALCHAMLVGPMAAVIMQHKLEQEDPDVYWVDRSYAGLVESSYRIAIAASDAISEEARGDLVGCAEEVLASIQEAEDEDADEPPDMV